MSRSALNCPKCQTPLGTKRKGGLIAPLPGVATGEKIAAAVTLLKCPRCGHDVEVPGVRPLLVPYVKSSAKLITN